MRAPGMKLMRMPMFTWMSLITQVLLLLAFPVITVALVMLLMDRAFSTHFFIPAGGGDPILWQHLFWYFGHPEVYIMALPAFGIISEVVPVFARKPIFGYGVMVASGVAIAFLSVTVWAHHMFTVGMSSIANGFFVLSTMAIAVPTGIKIFNWLATMWGGQIDYKTPMLFCVAFLFQFLIAGLTGAFVLTRGDLNGSEMAAILVKALPHLARLSARYDPPFIARIAASGKVQMIYRPGTRSR
jgi:cytochrome c oxidase subunit 1